MAEGGDIAILYRTNAQSRAIEELLIRKGIEYKLVGGTRFYDRAEVKDLLAFLRIVANNDDLVSWDRIEKAGGKRKKQSFNDWLLEQKGKLSDLPPGELLKEIIEQTKYLSQFDEKDEEDAGRLENIRELLAVASEYESLTAFLESAALVQSEDLADRKYGQAKTILMTIHAAKGLEFDEVVITGLEEGLLPHSRSLMDRADIEEERRLMYVAMTRAKKKLHLTFTRYR
ncbi:ATP-binding domain-containing protein, partial [Candidatus Collierbacteria bacterium]|nr:ATP-binding domain-containing protein [Candidatus Collierbacteria bacterium]